MTNWKEAAGRKLDGFSTLSTSASTAIHFRSKVWRRGMFGQDPPPRVHHRGIPVGWALRNRQMAPSRTGVGGST
jgi:hypothetical protein